MIWPLISGFDSTSNLLKFYEDPLNFGLLRVTCMSYMYVRAVHKKWFSIHECQVYIFQSKLTVFCKQSSITAVEDDVEWYLDHILTKSIVSANPHLRQVSTMYTMSVSKYICLPVGFNIRCCKNPEKHHQLISCCISFVNFENSSCLPVYKLMLLLFMFS